jgi:ribosomal peptide maturation radical SAM protein 1
MSTETLNNLDEIPIPNYDDYFSEIKSVDYSKYFNLRLLFESSRGCWWGERHHCTFCGLNGETMKHRSKSFQRVISELEEFESKYSGHTISVVDNILDMGYFKDLIPELKSNNKKYDLFYEVKANLKKEQISALSDVGIRMIQPGIESLSSEVLKEMNKGVSALQNIQLMKWSKEAGVLPIWNFLWGFPKERPEEYKKMNTIADKIFHLSPPKSYATIRIDRFSPNHSEYKKMGYDEIYPYPSYKYVYSSLSDDTINNLAYFFDYKSPNKENVPVYTKELSLKIKEWNIAFDESELFYVNIQDVMLVCDTRSNRPTQIYTISKLCSKIIELTDRAIPINEITHKLQSETNTNSHDINNALQYLCSKDLIIEDETKVLSLVVKLNDRYKPNVKSLKKMYEWLEQNATLDSQDNFIISHSQIGLTPQPS